MSDATQLATIVGVVTSAATALLTLAFTKGIDAYVKYRKDTREDRQQVRQGELQEESVALEVYRKVHEQLTQRVTTLEQQILAMQKDHLECIRDKEQLRGELNVVKKDLESLKRHEERTQQQIEANLDGIKKVEARIEGKA